MSGCMDQFLFAGEEILVSVVTQQLNNVMSICYCQFFLHYIVYPISSIVYPIRVSIHVGCTGYTVDFYSFRNERER